MVGKEDKRMYDHTHTQNYRHSHTDHLYLGMLGNALRTFQDLWQNYSTLVLLADYLPLLSNIQSNL